MYFTFIQSLTKIVYQSFYTVSKLLIKVEKTFIIVKKLFYQFKRGITNYFYVLFKFDKQM